MSRLKEHYHDRLNYPPPVFRVDDGRVKHEFIMALNDLAERFSYNEIMDIIHAELGDEHEGDAA